MGKKEFEAFYNAQVKIICSKFPDLKNKEEENPIELEGIITKESEKFLTVGGLHSKDYAIRNASAKINKDYIIAVYFEVPP